MLTKTFKQLFFAASIIALVVFSFTSCLKAKDTGCKFKECSVVAPASEIQSVQNYIASHNIIGAVQHCSGLYYKIDSTAGVGTGTKPDGCSTVNVKYKGYLTNGTVFDQNAAGITLSLQEVIRGWTIGVPLLKAGGKITLYIPPTLGYGSTAQGTTIPANSVLIFEITLVSVN